MYINLEPNKHKIISFNTTTMASLGFTAPPKKFRSPLKFIFLLRFLPQLFWSDNFRTPLKLEGGGAATMINTTHIYKHTQDTQGPID